MCNYALVNFGDTSTVPKTCGGFKDPGKIEDNSIRFITEDQFKIFIKEFDQDIVFRSLFTTLFYQGLRQGEALALTWDDVDFVKKELKINKTYTGKINRSYQTGSLYITKPKTKKSIRNIPIEENTLEQLKMLLRFYSDFPEFSKEWFVFGGIKPLSESTIAAKKNYAIRQTRVTKITIHQFRHSCASYLFENGAKPTAVQNYLGHSKLTTTMNIYTHLYPTDLMNIHKNIKNDQK